MQILQFPDSSWGLTVLKNIFLRLIGLKGLKMFWKKSFLIWKFFPDFGWKPPFFPWFPWLEKVFKIFSDFPDRWELCQNIFQILSCNLHIFRTSKRNINQRKRFRFNFRSMWTYPWPVWAIFALKSKIQSCDILHWIQTSNKMIKTWHLILPCLIGRTAGWGVVRDRQESWARAQRHHQGLLRSYAGQNQAVQTSGIQWWWWRWCSLVGIHCGRSFWFGCARRSRYSGGGPRDA